MPKLRKMLTDINAPYLQSLMRAIETQSIPTIVRWCTEYAQTYLLPLWQESFPDDQRPERALQAAGKYLAGDIKLPEAKKQILECRSAARETAGNPIAQGAARTIDASASAIHNPTGALGLALYGAVTLAYYQAGTDADWEVVEALAAGECVKMTAALQAISVKDEPNPAKIKWNC